MTSKCDLCCQPTDVEYLYGSVVLCFYCDEQYREELRVIDEQYKEELRLINESETLRDDYIRKLH